MSRGFDEAAEGQPAKKTFAEHHTVFSTFVNGIAEHYGISPEVKEESHFATFYGVEPCAGSRCLHIL